LQLQTAQALAREADEARDTAAALRRKVNALQNVQTVINGWYFNETFRIVQCPIYSFSFLGSYN
jgi:hypothetical protein